MDITKTRVKKVFYGTQVDLQIKLLHYGTLQKTVVQIFLFGVMVMLEHILQ